MATLLCSYPSMGTSSFPVSITNCRLENLVTLLDGNHLERLYYSIHINGFIAFPGRYVDEGSAG